jgi:hypothetical protein
MGWKPTHATFLMYTRARLHKWSLNLQIRPASDQYDSSWNSGNLDVWARVERGTNFKDQPDQVFHCPPWLLQKWNKSCSDSAPHNKCMYAKLEFQAPKSQQHEGTWIPGNLVLIPSQVHREKIHSQLTSVDLRFNNGGNSSREIICAIS